MIPRLSVLLRIVEQGWRVLAAGCAGDRTGRYDGRAIAAAAAAYAVCWDAYRRLPETGPCFTLYEGRYFGLPGSEPEPGLDASVAAYCRLAAAGAGAGE